MLEKERINLWLFTFPESIVAPLSAIPVNDHTYPVVPDGRAGAEYLYFLAPQIFVTSGVIVMLAGAAGVCPLTEIRTVSTHDTPFALTVREYVVVTVGLTNCVIPFPPLDHV